MDAAGTANQSVPCEWRQASGVMSSRQCTVLAKTVVIEQCRDTLPGIQPTFIVLFAQLLTSAHVLCSQGALAQLGYQVFPAFFPGAQNSIPQVPVDIRVNIRDDFSKHNRLSPGQQAIVL